MSLEKKNRRTFFILVSFVFGMIILSFASAPLYRIFCQVTGYGGTTQETQKIPDGIHDRLMNVRFHADISPSLPWVFQPLQKEISVRVGEQSFIQRRIPPIRIIPGQLFLMSPHTRLENILTKSSASVLKSRPLLLLRK